MANWKVEWSSRLGVENAIYVYIFRSNATERDRRKQWKFSYVLISSNTLPSPSRHISNSSLFAGRRMEEVYIKFSLGLENREVVRNIVKIIRGTTRLEGRKGDARRKKRKKEKGHATQRLPLLFGFEENEAKRDERPGPIITVISTKTSLSV